MFKKVIVSLLAMVCLSSFATTIKIQSPYSPSHSATPAMLKIIEKANALQSNYLFVLEFKPGGNQTLAVSTMNTDDNLAIIAPAFVDNVSTGKLDINNYVPVHALGNACWAVIANKPLESQKEFVVGGVGIGNASHLTALMLGKKMGFSIRYVVFKSNNDALMNMAANNGIEFVIDRYEGFEAIKSKNKNLRVVAASCPTRLPQQPKIKTLKEIGIDAPYVFNITVAHKNMDPTRRKAIEIILNSATVSVGKEEIFKVSAMRPPVFDNVTVDEFYTLSIKALQLHQTNFKTLIDEAR